MAVKFAFQLEKKGSMSADLIAKISLVFITLLSQIRASRQRLVALSATTGKTIFSLTKLLSLLR